MVNRKDQLNMKNKRNKVITTLVLSFGINLVLPATIVFGANLLCPPGATSPFCPGGLSSTTTVGDVIKTVVSVLMYLLGAVSVIVLIISGIRLALSGGKSDSVANSRNAIIYAVAGLLVARAAYAIVNFVLTEAGA